MPKNDRREADIASLQKVIESGPDTTNHIDVILIAFSRWQDVAARIPAREPVPPQGLSYRDGMYGLLMPVINEGKFTASIPFDVVPPPFDKQMRDHMEALRDEGFAWISANNKDVGLTSKGLATILQAAFEVMAEDSSASLQRFTVTPKGIVFPMPKPQGGVN